MRNKLLISKAKQSPLALCDNGVYQIISAIFTKFYWLNVYATF